MTITLRQTLDVTAYNALRYFFIKREFSLRERSSHFIIALGLLCLSVSTAVGATEREECRASKDNEKIIRCIELGIYDPCDDSGGKWGASKCAGAHTEIAERRIKKAEDKIELLLKDGDAGRAAYAQFQESQKIWLSFRDSYCRFTNAADDLKEFEGQFLHLGYCWRRLTEQRADELEALLQHQE